jgi:signal transduction histidine kinase
MPYDVLAQRLGELEKKNQQLTSFSHSVAHTLKNDWQAVGLIVDEVFALMQESEESGEPPPIDEILDFLRELRPRAAKGFRTVEDLLLYARAGGLPNLQRQSLRPLVQLVAERVGSKTISLAADFPDVELALDPDMFPVALLQVVENAVKYGQGKPVIIRYEAGALCVRDHGRGIPPDKITEIFEAFKRAATDLPGTGLGLSIAKQIVQAHGYAIEARSAGPGQGSEFVITFS